MRQSEARRRMRPLCRAPQRLAVVALPPRWLAPSSSSSSDPCALDWMTVDHEEGTRGEREREREEIREEGRAVRSGSTIPHIAVNACHIVAPLLCHLREGNQFASPRSALDNKVTCLPGTCLMALSPLPSL